MTPKPDIWSTTPPDRPGWWWLKYPAEDAKPFIVEVRESSRGLRARSSGDYLPADDLFACYPDYLWCPVDPPGSAKAERENSPLAQLEAWAKKHRRVSITAGGFAQPGDGWAVKLSERGREVIVDEYDDDAERLPASLSGVIQEALRRWEAGQ